MTAVGSYNAALGALKRRRYCGGWDGSVVGVPVGVGVAESVGVGLSDGLGLSDTVHGSGVAVGNSGGTDDSAIGPSTSGDVEGAGVAVAHGPDVGGNVGEAALDAGRPCGATIATPPWPWWRGLAVADAVTLGEPESAGLRLS